MKMKLSYIVIPLLLLFASGCDYGRNAALNTATETLLNQLRTAAPMKIAVVSDAESSAETAALIENVLSMKVTQDGLSHIRIVSRGSREHISREMELQYSMLSDPASRVEIGRLAGADAILIVKTDDEVGVGVFDHIVMELVDVATSRVIASVSVYSLKQAYEKVVIAIFIVILIALTVAFSSAAKKSRAFDVDTFGEYIRRGYELKNTVNVRNSGPASVSNVLLRIAAGAGLGMLGGFLLEELVEEIVPGHREFGMLGEIIGAITGIGIANRNEVFHLLRDFKSNNPGRPLNEIMFDSDFRNWERSHPDEAAKLKQLLAA